VCALATDDLMRPLRLLAARHGTVEDVQAVADGRQRVAQLVRQHRDEMVLVPIPLLQRDARPDVL